MINSPGKPLTGKSLFTFLTCLFFLQLTAQTPIKHTKPAVTKPQPQIQTVPDPPSPYAEIDKKALLLPDSLSKIPGGDRCLYQRKFSFERRQSSC